MGLGMCICFYAFSRDMKYSITKSLLILKVTRWDVCCSRTSNLHADIPNWLLLLIFSREVKMSIKRAAAEWKRSRGWKCKQRRYFGQRPATQKLITIPSSHPSSGVMSVMMMMKWKLQLDHPPSDK